MAYKVFTRNERTAGMVRFHYPEPLIELVATRAGVTLQGTMVTGAGAHGQREYEVDRGLLELRRQHEEANLKPAERAAAEAACTTLKTDGLWVALQAAWDAHVKLSASGDDTENPGELVLAERADNSDLKAGPRWAALLKRNGAVVLRVVADRAGTTLTCAEPLQITTLSHLSKVQELFELTLVRRTELEGRVDSWKKEQVRA